jgi:hypothetical protein
VEVHSGAVAMQNLRGSEKGVERMKIDGSDWKERPEKSEGEKLFDSLFFYRQVASISVKRLRIVKELERLLSENQTKFEEYLFETIQLYEKECELVLDVPADGVAPVPEELQDLYYDKNTTLAQWLFSIRITILDYLQYIKRLWNNNRVDEIAAELKIAHDKDFSMIFNAKKRIEKDFSLLENMTMQTIEDSTDTQKKEALKKAVEEMRSELMGNGYNV